MPQLTLYRSNGACSMVPHILLTEFNIPFNEVLLSQSSGKDFKAVDGSISAEEYLKIHPSGYVPALKIDNEILTENVALQNYLQTFAPSKQLLGKTPLEQARVAEWQAYISGSMHAHAVGMIGRPARFSDDKSTHDDITAKGIRKLQECFAEVDRRLGEREFAVGSQDTLADYYLFYFYFLSQAGMFPFDASPYKNYRRLTKRVYEKESVQKVLEKEGLAAVSID